MPKEPTPEVFEGLPVVSAQAMRALDQAATERFGLAVMDLMENAGRAVAEALEQAVKEAGRPIAGSKIVICCGRGANGGDGLVLARYLKEKGADVSVFICPPRKEGPGGEGAYPDPVRLNVGKARGAGIKVTAAGAASGLHEALALADLAVDALLGTGSSGKPAGAIHHMIQELNASKKPVYAIDLPSGIHPDTGYHSGVYVTALATFTLGLPKRGLVAPHARKYVGTLKVLDIGYPKELVAAQKPS